MGCSQRTLPPSLRVFRAAARRDDDEHDEKLEAPKSPSSPKSPLSSGFPSLTGSSVLLSTQTQLITSTLTSRTSIQSTPPALPLLSAPVTMPTKDIDSSAVSSFVTSTALFPTPLSAFSTTTISSSIASSIVASVSVVSLAQPTSAPRDSLIGERPPPRDSNVKVHLHPAAQAALITCAILGFIALVCGFIALFKRRRKYNSDGQHAANAFGSNDSGNLHAPATVHMADSTPSVEMPQNTSKNVRPVNFIPSATSSTYSRPQTASTDIYSPQTPNPFADAPRNKAYDQLRGRPRSTTLTDRGSWMQNPFKDPESDRFDPFGELQERAKAERTRYLGR